MNALFMDDDEVRQTLFKKVFDAKEPSGTLVQTRTASQTIGQLKSEKFDTLFLDHDLGGEIFVERTEETGYEVALFIETMDEKNLPNLVIIHSHNPAGAQRMENAIKPRVSNTFSLPFSQLMQMNTK